MRRRMIRALRWSLFLSTMACAAPKPTQRFPADAESLLQGFQETQAPARGAYDSLFHYFVLGWESYRRPEGSTAVYPGLPSKHGSADDRMEGFSRLAPVVAAWVSSGRPSSIELSPGKRVDL